MKKLSVLCAFCFVLSTLAYTSDDLANANSLADQQIVMKQTIASKYGLDNKILRQEVIGMALKVKGVTLPENYKCKKYYADATKNDWICRAVELAADNGIITRTNKYANPGKYVTRAEALAIVMTAGGFTAPSGATPPIFPYSDTDFSAWQSDLVLYAAGLGIITNPNVLPQSEGFKIIDNVKAIRFYPNRSATRAEVFGFTKNILNKPISSCATVGKMIGIYDVVEDLPSSCCGGLKVWDSGMDTAISVGNTCYETGLMAGAPVGTCLACGDNICSDIETPCNCPEDCKNGENADFKTVAEFCESSSAENLDPRFETYALCH